MADIDRTIQHLVIANRILAHEGVLDAYGHVSVRHPDNPDRFFLSVSRSPELVEVNDILEFDLDGSPVVEDDRPLYLERFIHAAFLAARPDAMTAVHSHTEALLPFGITDTPLRAVIHSASDIGSEVPVWDIRDSFGPDTDMLVVDLEQAEDLAATLKDNEVVLMRGHGFAHAGRSLPTTARMCVFLARNARVQFAAQTLGGPIKEISEGETAARKRNYAADSSAIQRAWQNWAVRAGCGHLLER
jgi:ribulose-5-phosphate 4-epimerase/fuculose-1-phosphate aldolase